MHVELVVVKLHDNPMLALKWVIGGMQEYKNGAIKINIPTFCPVTSLNRTDDVVQKRLFEIRLLLASRYDNKILGVCLRLDNKK